MSVEETVQAINTSEGNNVDTVLQAIGKLRSEEKDELVEMLYEKRLLISVYEKGNFSLAEQLVNLLPPSIYEFEELAITQYLKDKPQDYDAENLLEVIKFHSFEAVSEDLELEDEEQIPTQFTMVAEGKALQDKSGNVYQLGRALTGRGQPGLAAFYVDPKGKQLLIKEDDAATCVAEGSAYFVKEAGLLPKKLENSINYAKAGALIKSDGSRSVISTQNRVMPSQENGSVQPWDMLVYGGKRDPKTLFSSESWNPSAINYKIKGLNTDSQWELASAILGSVLAGDESLHVGQFMAILNENDDVIGLKRIDLGARERYAAARSKNTEDMDPYNTSSQYTKSGQLGKDYIGFLLSTPSLREKYTLLWMDLNKRFPDKQLADLVFSQSKQALMQQFENLPDQAKEMAYQGLLETVNKGSDGNEKIIIEDNLLLDVRIVKLAEQMAMMDANRITTMIQVATKEFESKINSNFTTLNFGPQITESYLEALQEGTESKVKKQIQDIQLVLAEKLQTLSRSNSNSPEEKIIISEIKSLCELSTTLLESYHLTLMNQEVPNSSVEQYCTQEIERYQTINDAINYYDKTTSPEKKPISLEIASVSLASKTKEDFAAFLYLAPSLDNLSKHTSYVGQSVKLVKNAVGWDSSEAEGALLVGSLRDRYHLKSFSVSNNNDQLLLSNVQQQINYCNEMLKKPHDGTGSNFNEMRREIQSTAGMLEKYHSNLLQSNAGDAGVLQYCNRELKRLESIDKAMSYYSTTTTEEKKPLILSVINKLINSNHNEFKDYLKGPQFQFDLKKFSEHTGASAAKGWRATSGEKFMNELSARYLGTMSPSEKNMFKLIRENKFSTLLELWEHKKITFEDATGLRDKKGYTLLHYLMMNAENKEPEKKLIFNIMKGSLGASYNTDLNLVDEKGTPTPGELLILNPNRAAIIKYLNGANSQKEKLRDYALWGKGPERPVASFFNQKEPNKQAVFNDPDKADREQPVKVDKTKRVQLTVSHDNAEQKNKKDVENTNASTSISKRKGPQ